MEFESVSETPRPATRPRVSLEYRTTPGIIEPARLIFSHCLRATARPLENTSFSDENAGRASRLSRCSLCAVNDSMCFSAVLSALGSIYGPSALATGRTYYRVSFMRSGIRVRIFMGLNIFINNTRL